MKHTKALLPQNEKKKQVALKRNQEENPSHKCLKNKYTPERNMFKRNGGRNKRRNSISKCCKLVNECGIYD